MKASSVVVMGASPKPDRYANRAMAMLSDFGHQAIPVNPAFEEIRGERCYASIRDVPGTVDTVTVYLNKARSDAVLGEILEKAPRRIILNPGAENDDLASRARARDIQVVEGCTLVMLQTKEF